MKVTPKLPTSRDAVIGNGERLVKQAHLAITPPNFQIAHFSIKGIAPLVQCRFSLEAQRAIEEAQAAGQTGRSKRKKKAIDHEALFKQARYYSKEGWEGFQASAIRNASVSACRLVGFKMVLAKLSIFVEPDGWDAKEPQISLVRLRDCEAVMQKDHVRNANTGQFSITTRAVYHNWHAEPIIRWDADQFTITDVTNLLARVGMQVGVGCGRPDSKESCGMGWGLFEIEGSKNER
jgi:hypothetical protein